jgi:hypothetical protein
MKFTGRTNPDYTFEGDSTSSSEVVLPLFRHHRVACRPGPSLKIERLSPARGADG